MKLIYPRGMANRYAYFDREADIVWLQVGEIDSVVSEEVGWGLLDRDESTGDVVAIEVWQASKTLPDLLLDSLPEPSELDGVSDALSEALAEDRDQR